MPASIPITKNQATNLATLLHDIRPDWGIQALITLIGKNRNHADLPQLAKAAITIATNPDKKTPAIIFLDGSHWNTHTTKPLQTTQPPTELHCHEHNTPETQCKNQHYATPIPHQLRTQIKPRATLQPKEQKTNPRKSSNDAA